MKKILKTNIWNKRMDVLFLFDIDGTILSLKQYHSKYLFYRAFMDLFGRCAKPDRMPNFSGMTDLQIIDDLRIMSDLPADAVNSRIGEIWTKLSEIFVGDITRENVELKPCITEFLDYLEKSNDAYTSLVTGNFRNNAYLKLKLFGLDKYFAVGAFGSDKADRNLLPALAIERSNELFGKKFSSRNSVIIGDSPRDMQCAKASGCAAVGVATGWHSADELAECGADFVFKDFTDYKEQTKKIFDFINNVR